MTTPFTPIDIVNFAANKDAVGIQSAFDQMVSAKIQDAIQQRKVEVAKSMFIDPNASQEGEEQQDDEQQTDGVTAGETEEQESEESHENAEQHA